MQSVPNQPPGIRMRVPIIGQQQPAQQQQLTPEQQEQMARMQVMQAVSGLASRMYVELAASCIAIPEAGQDANEKHFRPLAKQCLIAAKAFVEELGVFETKPDSELAPDGREDRQSD